MNICPLCGGTVRGHDYVRGYYCGNFIAGRLCEWQSQVVIFTEPLPPSLFGLDFLARLIEASDASVSGSS